MSPRAAKTRTVKASKGEGPRCPICRKPVVKDYRPFCSKRCAEIDLGRWLKGQYAVPGEPAAEGGGVGIGGFDEPQD